MHFPQQHLIHMTTKYEPKNTAQLNMQNSILTVLLSLTWHEIVQISLCSSTLVQLSYQPLITKACSCSFPYLREQLGIQSMKQEAVRLAVFATHAVLDFTDVATPADCICFRVVASQSRPSYKPSPFGAQVPWICQRLLRRLNRPIDSHTSAVLRAPFCTTCQQSGSILWEWKKAG